MLSKKDGFEFAKEHIKRKVNYVPYTQFELDKAVQLLKNQAAEIEKNLRQDPEFVKNYGDANMQDKEIVALIAYLQRLGTDIKGEQTAKN